MYLSSVRCSVAPAVALAQPGITYTRVAPPSTLPFAASVSTFTRGLNVLAAPYAAGIPYSVGVAPYAGGVAPYAPGVVSYAAGASPYPYYTRSIAPAYPATYSPNLIPTGVPALNPSPVVYTSNAVVPSPLLPNSFRANPNVLTRAVPVPTYPGAIGVPAATSGVAVPSSLLPAPFGVEGRSVHAVGSTVPHAHTLG